MLNFLRDQSVITLFLTLGLGCLLGRIRIGSIALGAVTGTLLISLALGTQGFRISPAAQAVGFALFIFSVGYQAGPRFFEILRAEGWRYFCLAWVVCGVGFGAAVVAGKWLALPAGGTAGLFSGAMTATPTLAAAQESVRNGIVPLPADATAEQVIATIGTHYAISYVIGMLGIILAIRILPRCSAIDLAAQGHAHEAHVHEQQLGEIRPPRLYARAYRITNERFHQRPLGELIPAIVDEFAVARIRRAGQWLGQTSQERLMLGDELHIAGSESRIRGGIAQLGDEIVADPAIEHEVIDRKVVVNRKQAVGRTLAELDLASRMGLVILELRRDGLPLPLEAHLPLQHGDVLTLSGPARAFEALAASVGTAEADPQSTDMTTFTFGIALGTALGVLTIEIAGVPVGLGTAGGLLVAGIAVGWLNSARPTIGRFPDGARWILTQFGLLIFICGVGLQSGARVLPTLQASGSVLLLASVFVVLAPVVVGYVVGLKVLKLQPVLLLGALAGAMTSGAALSMLIEQVKGPAPSLGYTGTYAFASVTMTVLGTLVMLV